MNPHNIRQLQTNIRYWRIVRELSLMKLAELADINYNTMWSIENVTEKPSFWSIYHIARALDITFDQLTAGFKHDE